MFSGKTEELLRRVKRARLARQRVQLFKPRVDDRYDAVKVVSHEGVNADAIPVSSADELLSHVTPDTAVVGIDEVQFFDAGIVAAAETLADARHPRASRPGSTRTTEGEPFGPMPALLSPSPSTSRSSTPFARECGGAATRVAAPRRERGTALRRRRGRVRGALPRVLRSKRHRALTCRATRAATS